MSGGRRGCGLLLLGLDGADWQILDPLLEAGALPALQALLDERGGQRAVLESTLPPVTFPAWASFFTGLAPAEHGILDFARWTPGRYALTFHSGRPAASTFLMEAAVAGQRVCTLGFPGTSPPLRLPGGFCLSGFDAPVALQAGPDAAWPPARHRTLRRRHGPWPFAEIDELKVAPGWHTQALAALEAGLARKLAYAETLLREQRWDLFAIHLGETDTVGHHFLAFGDPGSPRRPARVSAAEAGAVATIYRAADRALGRLRALAGPEASVMIASDHGMESSSDQVLHPNRALAGGGFCALAPLPEGLGGLPTRARQLAVAKALRHLPGRLKAQLFRALGATASRLETERRLGEVDLARSAAFSESLTYAPSVRLNLRGRDPKGCIRPEDAHAIAQAVRDHLLSLEHPETGAALIEAVWLRDEVHRGPAAEEAPDLLFLPARHRGYRVTVLGARGPGPVLETLRGDALLGGKGQAPVGVHRREGVLAVTGPRFEFLPGCLPITAAAALCRRALGISKDEALRPEGAAGISGGSDRSASAYTPAQAERVRQRLAAMGYL